MGYNPRRITKIEIDITFPKDYDSRTKTMLERAAFNCQSITHYQRQKKNISFTYLS